MIEGTMKCYKCGKRSYDDNACLDEETRLPYPGLLLASTRIKPQGRRFAQTPRRPLLLCNTRNL
jgi:hypothetical protein